MGCLGLCLLSPSSNMQALQTLLLVMNPHCQHFCLVMGFFLSVIFMHSAEQIMSTIDCGLVLSICFINSRTCPRQAKGLQMHSVEKQSSFLWQAQSTISFSQAYFRGLILGRERGSSSQPEMVLTHIPKRLRSPRSMFIRTVSAISSALWPVTTLEQPNLSAPLSRACLLSTPQQVQLLVWPMALTIQSIVQPQSYLQESICRGSCSQFWLRLTASNESSRYPLMPSSIASMQSCTPY